MIDLIQGLIIVTIEIMCCKIFLNTFLKSRFYRNKIMNSILMMVVIVSAFLNSVILAPYMYLKICSYLLLMSIFMIIYFQSSYIKTIFLLLIYQALLVVVDYIAIIGIDKFMSEEQKLKLDDTISGTLVVLMCRLVVFLIIMVIKKKWSNNENKLSLISTSEWLRLLYFPILSIFAILSMLLDSNRKLLIAFGLVIMNIILLYLLESIIAREDKVFREKIKGETDRYRSISQHLENQRKQVHEFKNQIMCIEGMLGSGETGATLNFLHKVTDSFNDYVDVIDTNNVIVNAVLNSKYKEAISKNIVFVLKASDLSNLILEDEDIVTILSNLLNNAIEACEKVKERKLIKVKITIEGEMIVISVKNTVSEPVKIINNQIETTKSNKNDHGFGIENVQSAINKYKGTGVMNYMDGYFSFSIIIPC